MKIEDILKEQGEIYKNLPDNKTTEKYNKEIEKPKITKAEKTELETELDRELGDLSKLKKPVGVSAALLGLGGLVIGSFFKLFPLHDPSQHHEIENLHMYFISGGYLISGILTILLGITILYKCAKKYRTCKSHINKLKKTLNEQLPYKSL